MSSHRSTDFRFAAFGDAPSMSSNSASPSLISRALRFRVHVVGPSVRMPSGVSASSSIPCSIWYFRLLSAMLHIPSRHLHQMHQVRGCPSMSYFRIIFQCIYRPLSRVFKFSTPYTKQKPIYFELGPKSLITKNSSSCASQLPPQIAYRNVIRYPCGIGKVPYIIESVRYRYVVEQYWYLSTFDDAQRSGHDKRKRQSANALHEALRRLKALRLQDLLVIRLGRCRWSSLWSFVLSLKS